MISLLLILLLVIAIIYVLIKSPKNVKIITIIIISIIIICYICFRFYIIGKVNNNLIQENKISRSTETEYNKNIEGEHIIKKYEELEKLIERKKLNASIFSEFNRDFFNSNDLIVYIHSTKNSINKIYTSNEKLIIVIHNPGSIIPRTEITNIEVAKNSINDVNKKWEDEIWWWKLYQYGILAIFN